MGLFAWSSRSVICWSKWSKKSIPTQVSFSYLKNSWPLCFEKSSTKLLVGLSMIISFRFAFLDLSFRVSLQKVSRSSKLMTGTGIEKAIGHRTLSDKKCYMSGTDVSKQDILSCTLSLIIICGKSFLTF